MPAPKWPPPIKVHRKSRRCFALYRGVQHWLGPADPPEPPWHPEVRRSYAELLALLATAEPRPAAPANPPTSLTVAEVFARWQAEEAPRYGESRERVNVELAFAPLLKLYTRTPAAEIDALALEKVRGAMIALRWSRVTINNNCGRIRTVWRWAERQRLLPRGSWANLRTLPPLLANDARVKESPRRRATTWEELQQVLGCCVPPLRAALLVQWWTGCRSQDVRRMKVGQVDRRESIWIYHPHTHKNAWRGQERDVLIGPRAQEVLLPWLEDKTPVEWVFPCHAHMPRHVRKPYDWFHGERCYSCRSYGSAGSRAARRAGVEGWSPYTLRHAAKRRITRAEGLDAARSFLGQSSIQATDGYAHSRDMEVAAAVAARHG